MDMAHRIEYTLEVIDGYMRPVVEGMKPEENWLMWSFLAPFPVLSAAFLEGLEDVEGGGSEGWVFESPEARITCTPETLTLEDKEKEKSGDEPLKIELPLKDA